MYECMVDDDPDDDDDYLSLRQAICEGGGTANATLIERIPAGTFKLPAKL